MPMSAFALLLFFTAAAFVVGVVVTWVTGPRRRLAIVIPVLAAFGALYLVGHRSGLAVGPTVELFGFQVNLLFDLGAAVLGAATAAIAQRMVVGRMRRGRAGA